MVRKILEKKPKKVTISVNMTDVKKGCQKAQVRMMLLLLFPADQFISQNDSDNSDSEKGQTEDEVRLTSARIYKYSRFTSQTVHNCQTWKLHSQRSGTTL